MSLTKLNNQSLSAVTSAGLPAGTVLQVIQDIETAAGGETLNVGVFSTAILSATITPSSSSSKILVFCSLHLSTGVVTAGAAALLKRGSTSIGLGDAFGSGRQATGGGMGAGVSNRLISNISMTVLDTPSTTSAITYTAHGGHGYTSSQDLYWNREQRTVENASHSRVSSTLTLMEIAG
jgi:hypothetical protein